MRYEMPDCEWKEVYENRGHIVRGNIHYFISRMPDQPVPFCLRGQNEYRGLNLPFSSDLRHVMKRLINIEDDTIISFIYETLSNSLKHGWHDESGKCLVGTFPSLIIEVNKDDYLIIVQDIGIGIERHRASKILNRINPDLAKLGLEKILRIAPKHKIHLDERGMVVQASFLKYQKAWKVI